ncbi:Rho guanine nucleotide exchange factor scd1 [Serendipita indica DSM 11827]|nr:Rho guanine nucleotide exchange factor scd1 [Serendipita indica DSM 11827]
MSTSTRKKSLTTGSASSASISVDTALHIDTPVAMNTMLNKQAATSLYQQCLALRNRLLRVHDFAPYLSLIDKHTELASLDVVHRLWHTLALGTPLCFLYNLLDMPRTDRLNVNTDPDEIDLYEQDPDAALKAKKKAAAFFIMGIQKLKNAGKWTDDIELFTVTELTNLDNKDTNGFVKVVATTSYLLDQLPQHVWMEDVESPPPSAHEEASNRDFKEGLGDDSPPTLKPANAQEIDRNNVIRELIETERKYIQDLEVMHNYAKTLMTQNIVDHDTVHHLFPGLNKLLDFQRKFSIELEQQYELPWEQQRWGRCFSLNEPNFSVYEPYCANYTNAAELVLAEEPHLMQLTHIINPKSELPAFLIKPVQRICKYPLLLEQLVKRCPANHEHYEELVEGAASSKRIADRINEAQRRAENVATVKLLEKRVEDWKGHALSNFGELLLDDVFMVTKSGVDREYHVFLFEKIILCCKDATAPSANNKKVGKSNSILKKQSTGPGVPPGGLLAGGAAAAKKKTTPLLLKGRIFLNNVTQATPTNQPTPYSLQVWWRGDDDLEFFTLRCRTEEQVKQWETVITRLIQEVQAKREERNQRSSQGGQAYHSSHGSSAHERMPSESTSSVSTLPPYSANPVQRRAYGSYSEEKSQNHYGAYNGGSYYGHQPQSAPSYHNGDVRDGFERDDDIDDYDSSAGGYTNGRSTPVGANGRRGAGMSMPPERDGPAGYERSRVKTEDASTMAQWRQQHGANGMSLPPRPSASRNISNASGVSTQSFQTESSFGNGVGTRPNQPMLRNQLSSGRLRAQYESGYDDGSRHSSGNPARTRAISNPSASYAYQHQAQAPPVPIAPQWTGGSQSSGGGVDRSRIASGPSRERLATNGRNTSSLGMRRPISGGSSDTGEDSEQSPIGNSPMNQQGGTLRGSRSQVFNGQPNHAVGYGRNGYASATPSYGNNAYPGSNRGPQEENEPPVKIKVYWLDDLFVIMVPRTTSFDELVHRVQRKIRLCGGGNTDGPLRLKYDDEDGDHISLSTDEELQMAFDMTLSRSTGQGQLTLRVH